MFTLIKVHDTDFDYYFKGLIHAFNNVVKLNKTHYLKKFNILKIIINVGNSESIEILSYQEFIMKCQESTKFIDSLESVIINLQELENFHEELFLKLLC